MTILNAAVEWIRTQPALAFAITVGVLALLLVLNIVTLTVCSQLAKRQKNLLQGTDGKNIEQLLVQYIARAEAATGLAERAESAGASANLGLKHCLQSTGLVRYDAFSDITGKQSFSLALLDANGNGIVLSGLYSRNNIRIYAKPILNRSSELPLTDEERAAIAEARPGGNPSVEMNASHTMGQTLTRR